MGKLIRRMGIPTFAVSALLLVVLIAAYVMGQSLPVLFTDILRRVGMNGILVLAMVPSIKSGVGPNFALPIGIVGGLFAQLGQNEGFDFRVGGGAAFGANGLIAFSRLAVHPAGKHNLRLVFILVFRPSLGVCSGGAGSGSGHGFTSLS